jgi:hypothetical protein
VAVAEGVSVDVSVGVGVGVSLTVSVGVGVGVGVVGLPDAAAATPIPPVATIATTAATISGRGTGLRDPSDPIDSSSCRWSSFGWSELVGDTLSSISG